MRSFTRVDAVEKVTSHVRKLIEVLPDTPELMWNVMWIGAVLNPESELNYLDLEKSIHESKAGLSVSKKEMRCFLESVDQVIDLLIAGDTDSGKIRRYESDVEMFDECRYVISLEDGDYWEIHSKDSEFIEAVERMFSEDA